MCVRLSGVETQPRAHGPLSGTLSSQVNQGLKGWVQTFSSREGFVFLILIIESNLELTSSRKTSKAEILGKSSQTPELL